MMVLAIDPHRRDRSGQVAQKERDRNPHDAPPECFTSIDRILEYYQISCDDGTPTVTLCNGAAASKQRRCCVQRITAGR